MKNEITGMKLRLIVMNFLQFAVWGAYLTSMGTYLFNIGLGAKIGLFYAMQGIVSLFMPAIMGIIADRWVPAQKLYGFCHFMAAVFMVAAGWYGYVDGEAVNFGTLFTFYSLSVAFYMPTLALTNSVAYTALDKVKLDPVIAFPPIRIFGTIGFICSMLLTDILGFQNNYMQFFSCACFGVILAVYALTLPECPVSRGGEQKSLVDAMGLRAFTLFKQKKMAIFFIFSMLLGVSLQITNGFANPFLSSFKGVPYEAYRYNQFYDGRYIISGLTTAEMLLNKAEAQIRQGMWQEGLKTLDVLREKRYEAGTYISLSAGNQSEALSIVLAERRREMPFSMRIPDIKRYGVNEILEDDVTVVKNFFEISMSEVFIDKPKTYTIPSNSLLWAMPINDVEIGSSNGAIQQNRYE